MRRTPPSIHPSPRAENLRHAERLRRAAALLEIRARRCLDEMAPAHGEALREARAMVRAMVDSGEVSEP
jgi:hypothetical protein